MNTIDFDQTVDRRGSLSVKWNPDAIKSFCGNPDAEPFWVADMDFRVAPQIQNAVIKAAETGAYGYPHFTGVKEAFQAFAKKRHGLDVDLDDVVTSCGVLTSISIMMETLTEKGDGVIIPFPAYQPFVNITTMQERTVVRWPLDYNQETHTFSINFQKLEELAPKARMVLFCSPQNPAGLEFSKEELEKLCEICEKHHLILVCDEIHADLAYGKHTSIYEVAKNYDIVSATTMAPSKTFNIAGEHFSVVLSTSKELKDKLTKTQNTLHLGETSYFSTTAAKAAYEEGYDWLMQLIGYLQENARFIDSYLKQHCPELAFHIPRASFISLIDGKAILPLIEKDAKKHPEIYTDENGRISGLMSRFFGHYASVACNDGTWFGGDDYKQFIRFNFGVRRERIQAALERMTKAVEELKKAYC